MKIKSGIIFQKFKVIKNKLLNVKVMTVVIAVSGLFFTLLFMNCSSTDRPLSKSELPSSEKPAPPRTNPNPPEGTPRVEPGPTSNITWLHTDISAWEKTSQITNVEIKENGEVCIYHSKSGQWEAKSIADSDSDRDPSTSDSVEGHAWIIVPIDDKYYAAIYDYLIAGEPCHALDTGSIANLYDSDKSLGKRTGKEPLNSWIALGGDTIYFMVSGLVEGGKSNVEERSGIIKITLPSTDGEDPTIVHPPCEEDPTGPHCTVGQCNIPNRSGIVREIARDDPDQLQEGHELNSESGDISSDDSRWAFMDAVLEELHETDNHWGYECVDEDCEDVSTDTIAYLCDNNDPNTVPIDIILANGEVQWDVLESVEDRWKYPRIGQTTTTTTQGGEEGDGGGEGGEDGGDTSRCTGVPNGFSVVQRVAAATGDLYRTNTFEFTGRVASCLATIDSNWGRRINSTGPVSNDVVAYRLGGSDDAPCGVDIVAGARGNNPSLSWQQPTSYTGSRWQAAGGSCDVSDLPIPCTSEQEADGFLTIDGNCTPLCARLGFYGEGGASLGNISDEYYDLYGDILKHVEVNEGDACDTSKSENEDYNILPITIKTVAALSGELANSCCRRSKKKDCSAVNPHYSLKTVAGEEGCYPSCGQAAEYAGYSVADHAQSDLNKACNASTIGGRYRVRTWRPVPDFYDPYNFKILDSTKVVTDNPNQFCCVKGSPSHEPSLEHNEDGTYDVIAGTPVSTSTTTTNANGSSSTTSTTDNSNNGCSFECDSGLICNNGVCQEPDL